MDLINFQLVTPEKTVLSQELASLTCPTEMGEITILPGHEPLVAALKPGEINAKTATGDFFLFVSGGFVEVRPGSEVIMLADAAEHHYEIDEQRAEEAKRRAEAELKERKLTSSEYAAVTANLERSLARIRVARKHAHRKAPVTGEGVLGNNVEQ